MNPRPLQLSHNGTSNERNISIVKCWENARPLIKELEQTVNFAERKYGDLMHQLNLCKEYYERWSNERFANSSLHKIKPKRRFCRKSESTKSLSENESEKVTVQQMNNNFNEKLRNKIYEITNEIKEANRKIVLKDVGFTNCSKGVIESGKDRHEGFSVDGKEPRINNTTESIPAANDAKWCKTLSKRRATAYPTRYSTMQKYKLRSKSLPQGVRRKFGFGSFVEIVDKQRSKPNVSLLKIKSRTTMSSGSKSTIWKEAGRPKSKLKSRFADKPKSSSKDHNRVDLKPPADNSQTSGDTRSNKSCKTEVAVSRIQDRSDVLTQNIRSCTSFSNSSGSSQAKLSTTYLSEGNDSKIFTSGKQKSLILAPRQAIPFTICRTAQTFNLGLNIQQVLSLIKSKRHSAMLQAIIKDNIRTARSVIHKTDPNIKALYIATSSRIGTTSDSEARDDGDHCYSIFSTNTEKTIKCNMLTCRQSIREHGLKEEMTSLPLVTQIDLNEIQRPEDVWVVEQPDPRQSLQRFHPRCTCFPSRHSVNYQKVLKQYSRIKEKGEKAFQSFDSRFVVSGTEFCAMSPRAQFTYNANINPKFEITKVQQDLDNLTRRYERLQEQVTIHNVNQSEADAELDTLELELNYREEDCKTILKFYNQLTSLKRRIKDLRGKIRSTTNITEISSKPPRSKKDPFRPTPSMTLTRVLRQIQCLQDKIKLIDSPSVT